MLKKYGIVLYSKHWRTANRSCSNAQPGHLYAVSLRYILHKWPVSKALDARSNKYTI